jgi:branched-chain amino acid transport system substrate-binding protein
MKRRLDFRILGPLEVLDGEERLRLGGRKQRALLAILVVHANEVVSAERLIDMLWGESPPETAATALHGYVSQLRKLLEPDRQPGTAPTVLVTHEPGYVLRVEPDQLDVERFTILVGAARNAIADGRPDDAEVSVRDALALWRGAPLADLENEPFAHTELPRLAELRLTAVEERFEAELALGRERALISELEGHISRNPLRERPRGQLMLALYREGRQAEALRAYQEVRHVLVEQVGIEPGAALRQLERAILEQEVTLGRPTPSEGRIPELPARRAVFRRRASLLAVAVMAVAGFGIALLAGHGSRPSSVAKVRPGSVVAIDLTTNEVSDVIPVGSTPTSVSAGADGVWVLDADRQTVSRIEPRTHEVKTLGTGGVPTDLAAGAGTLWVGNGRNNVAQFVGPLATTVSSIDPESGAIRATVELPRARGATSNANASHIAVTHGAVWVVDPDFSVSRIDPRSNQITDTVQAVSAVAVSAGDAGVWVLNEDGSLARISGGAVDERVRLATNGLSSVAVGAGAVWATAPYDGVVWRIDPEPRLVERTITVGVGANAVTVGGGAVWVINALAGTVSRIDPSTNRVVHTIALGGTPRSAAVAAGRLWVSVAGAGSTPAARAASSGIDGLPSETCGGVFYGGMGKPDRLIVSDMPLRGGPRIPTRQMAQAIAFILRQRGFQAGRFRVGYQSCDDSTTQSGIDDPAKCAANAKAYVAKSTVIGVVGPYNSACAVEEIPIANAASGGPLAIVSPTNSDVNLTRAGPSGPEGGVRALYPTGSRNYARLYPTEANQGAADAVLSRQLGARRVFVLSDGGYGETMAFYFRQAATRLGLHVVGVSRWDPRARSYAGLAARANRAQPDAVFLSGLLDTNGGTVLETLRAKLGPDVKVIANDGFLPISSLFKSAGHAARGVHVSFGGLPPELLGPEGRNFVRDFAATQPGPSVQRHSVYAAAAAATLLDAIASSDGTRSTVTRNLLAAHPRRGITAPFSFDSSGDVLPSPITIVRAERGGGDDTIESIDGASIERVIRPLRSLIR